LRITLKIEVDGEGGKVKVEVEVKFRPLQIGDPNFLALPLKCTL
jgi:hypothetical protein